MQRVDSYRIEEDRSGQGHCWRHVDPDDLPPSILEEIEAEALEGPTSPGQPYRAKNGLYYRWFPLS